jgi:hypothetical protein
MAKKAGRYVLPQLTLQPDCPSCPKYKLYPGPTFGLHPKNALAVRLYYLAARDDRLATMGGAPLMSGIDPGAAIEVLDLYDDHFATQHDKQVCFEKMMVINQVSCEVRRGKEEREQAAREAQATVAASSRGRGGSRELGHQ